MTSDTKAAAAPGWEVKERPPMLFRRFEFDGYGSTRAFLEALESLSKELDLYPDISFAAKYANITVHARDGAALTEADFGFARRVAELAGRAA